MARFPKKKIFPIAVILSVVLLGIIYLADGKKQEDLSQKEAMVTTTLQKPLEVLVSNNQLEQGDTLVVIIENLSPEEQITGEFDRQLFDFFPIGTDGKQIGIVGIDAGKTPGDYSLSVSIPNEENTIKTITVKKKRFSNNRTRSY
ncbi:MAG: hypothetical protein WC042_01485 [Candidatus Paceibacterota bacterium]